MSKAIPEGVEIRGRLHPQFEQILSADALVLLGVPASGVRGSPLDIAGETRYAATGV